MDFRDVFKGSDDYRVARARGRRERQAAESTPHPPPLPRDPIGPQPIEGGDQRPWYRKKRWIAAMVVGLFVVISATGDDNAVEPAPAPVDTQQQEDTPEPDVVEDDGILDPGSDPYAFSYSVAHGQCIDDPEPIYSQAGTDDPYEAAVWLAAVNKPGPHREGGIAGCYDALLGKPARY